METLVIIAWVCLTTGATGQGTACLPRATAEAVIADAQTRTPDFRYWLVPCAPQKEVS
jgi:hypothetical protein